LGCQDIRGPAARVRACTSVLPPASATLQRH